MLRRHACHLATAVAVVASALAATPPAHAAGIRIYPLGDSITYGYTWGVGLPVAPPSPVPGGALVTSPGGYRQPLDLLLTASGVPHELVGSGTGNSSPLLDQQGQAHHDGHNGYRIEQDAANLDGRPGIGGDNGGFWLTGIPGRGPITPDVTVIHLGTNDIGQRFDPGTTYPTGDGRVNLGVAAQRATFVTHMTTRLQALVDKLLTLRPGSRIVLSNVLPIGTGTADPTTGEYAVAVADLVTRERAAGARIVYADVWTRFTAATPNGTVVVPGLLSPDSVHPVPAGYAVMAAVYRDAILAALALP
jgi:lysophospholipase L1-like esterase